MADAAHITGAPKCAPVILNFPDSSISRARRELARCGTHDAHRDWTRRWRFAGLSSDELVTLACASARRHLEISLAEGF